MRSLSPPDAAGDVAAARAGVGARRAGRAPRPRDGVRAACICGWEGRRRRRAGERGGAKRRVWRLVDSFCAFSLTHTPSTRDGASLNRKKENYCLLC